MTTAASARAPALRPAALLVPLAAFALAPAIALPPPFAERSYGVLLWHESPNDLEALEGMRAALDVAPGSERLLVRHAGSDREAAQRILGEFRAEKVDLVFSLGTDATLIAKDEVLDVPVVFGAVTNPVESGIVPSWSGSGTNVAGTSNWIRPDAVLRVFRLAVPRLEKLGLLRSSSTGVVSAAELRAMRKHLAEAGSAGASLEIVEEVVASQGDLEAAVARLAAARVQAVWIPIDFLIYENMPAILEATRARRLPLVSSSLRGAEKGSVAGIHVDYRLLGAKTVEIALRILERGEAPGTIPVLTLHDYRVVANLAAAKRCGYDLPLALLVQADLILDGKEPPMEPK